ncbi:hypothetical protein [Planomonospora venezuelensis]|uniref:Uncharacterized protein n=1 Tax=Planomonospora venezuelensis TaxID=1999 RepID=A0A841D427_PLAVE|nr:hypothetical protein [Planomonospora venezuelensis]MBB5964570.1 hypothetical protein [Planomonospora venezuelensis]GIN02867.1 hypothetical protein Pve01_45250 [Planomonospora venezuelensis]
MHESGTIVAPGSGDPIMPIFGRAEDLPGRHSDPVEDLTEQGTGRAQQEAGRRTGGRYGGQIGTAASCARLQAWAGRAGR